MPPRREASGWSKLEADQTSALFFDELNFFRLSFDLFPPLPPTICCRQRKKDSEMQVSMEKKFREAVMSSDVQDVFRDIEKAQVCSCRPSVCLSARALACDEGIRFLTLWWERAADG